MRGVRELEKEVVMRFVGKFVKVVFRSTDTNRASFKLYGTLLDVTDESVIIHTDRDGAILLKEILSIEEATPKYGGDR